MTESKKDASSYKQILKATSVYGGVQVFSIIISIIRSKTIALWLGPAGMGIFAVFNSFILVMGSLANLGMSTSAVKNVSVAYATGDSQLFSRTAIIFQRILLITGTIGFLSTILLSKYLSELNFQNSEYTWSFILISIVILLNQLQQGKSVILQGTQRVKQLATATFWGLLLGLIINLPLFYIWREKAIVASILVTAVISLLGMVYFSRGINYTKTSLSLKQLRTEGAVMIKMGILISITSLATQFCSYTIRVFIVRYGNIVDLGLYSSGFALVSTYFGMIFTAMGTDYYPRLSKIASNEEQAFFEMNKQAEVAILLLTPLLCIFLVFIKIIITILLSTDFLPIVPMVKWAVIGIFFQACSWSIAFIFLAKGHSKQFLINESITIGYLFLINILCYHWLGLVGLGIGFMTQYVVYTAHMIFIAKKIYGFYFTKATVKMLIMQLLLVLACFSVTFLDNTYMYLIGITIIIASCLFSFKKLDRAMGLTSVIKSKLRIK